jgi:hypothetical protein
MIQYKKKNRSVQECTYVRLAVAYFWHLTITLYIGNPLKYFSTPNVIKWKAVSHCFDPLKCQNSSRAHESGQWLVWWHVMEWVHGQLKCFSSSFSFLLPSHFRMPEIIHFSSLSSIFSHAYSCIAAVVGAIKLNGHQNLNETKGVAGFWIRRKSSNLEQTSLSRISNFWPTALCEGSGWPDWAYFGQIYKNYKSKS